MKGKLKRKKIIPVLISVAAVLPLTVIFVLFILTSQRQRNIENAYSLLAQNVGKLEYAVESRLSKAQVLEMMVISENGELEQFETVAKELFNDDHAIRGIQLAPNGVVTKSYPNATNEEGMIDLFSDPMRKADAEFARDNNVTTVSGPYELLQGGMGIVTRNPIYLEKNGKNEFWGFSIVVLNVPDIFDVAQLNLLTQNDYYYRIYRKLPDSGEIQTIYANTTEQFDNSIKADIHLPNTEWQLTICPMGGWISKDNLLWNILAAVIFEAVCAAILSVILILIQKKDELIFNINTDSLTGLYNYHYFKDKTTSLSSTRTPYSMIYITIANLREIEGKYGNSESADIIKEMAERIKNSAAPTDTIMRVGRYDFAVLSLTSCSEKACAELKERLKTNIGVPYQLFDNTITPHARIGYAIYPDEADNLEKMQWLSDKRLSADRD